MDWKPRGHSMMLGLGAWDLAACDVPGLRDCILRGSRFAHRPCVECEGLRFVNCSSLGWVLIMMVRGRVEFLGQGVRGFKALALPGRRGNPPLFPIPPCTPL